MRFRTPFFLCIALASFVLALHAVRLSCVGCATPVERSTAHYAPLVLCPLIVLPVLQALATP